MLDIKSLVEKLNSSFDNGLELSECGHAVYAKKEHIIKLMQILKDDFKCFMLADLTSVDYNDRFEVVYHLMQLDASLVRIKVKLPKDAANIPSIVSVWKAADVAEREVFDLMGIIFEGHGNLKRILCKDDFEGHPLRKDFLLNPVSRF